MELGVYSGVIFVLLLVLDSQMSNKPSKLCREMSLLVPLRQQQVIR